MKKHIREDHDILLSFALAKRGGGAVEGAGEKGCETNEDEGYSIGSGRRLAQLS